MLAYLLLSVPLLLADAGAWHREIPRDPDPAASMRPDPRPFATCPPPMDDREAFMVLLRTQEIAPPLISGTLNPTPEAMAWNRLMDRPDAWSIFEDLWERAHLPGRLYALCAFWHLDPPLFEERLESLRGMDEKVAVVRGCIVWRRPVEEVLFGRDGVGGISVRAQSLRRFAPQVAAYQAELERRERIRRMVERAHQAAG